MRFASLISFLVAFGLSLPLSASAQSIDLNETKTQNFVPQMVKGKQVDKLKTPEGFTLNTLGNGFGNISALTHDDNGNLYIADQDSGRIWWLTDRNRDSRIDSKRALPHRFDQPTGLAVFDTKLFVADKNAVWVMIGSQPPQILARLREADSIGAPHPLALSQNGTTLFLALKTNRGDAKVLSVNIETGVAKLLESAETSQTIRALISLGNPSPWALLDHSIGPSLNQSTQFSPTQIFKGLAIPPRKSAQDLNWPESLLGHLYASRQSANGYDIISIPASFGQADNNAEILLSGFLSTSGRTAWGAPTAMQFDRHGLIFADSYNGDIYRISAKPVIEPEPKNTMINTSAENDIPPLENKANGPQEIIVSTITGSQIENASTLDSASGLDVGSTIIRDYEPLSLEDTSKDEKKTDKKASE